MEDVVRTYDVPGDNSCFFGLQDGRTRVHTIIHSPRVGNQQRISDRSKILLEAQLHVRSILRHQDLNPSG